MNPSSSILGSHIDDVMTAEDATAKLNRKLADKKAAESFTHKGKSSTSLPVWQQVVTDERGIRRFHGAFTGGFSAGYGGTVGSKDGFTPTQLSAHAPNVPPSSNPLSKISWTTKTKPTIFLQKVARCIHRKILLAFQKLLRSDRRPFFPTMTTS